MCQKFETRFGCGHVDHSRRPQMCASWRELQRQSCWSALLYGRVAKGNCCNRPHWNIETITRECPNCRRANLEAVGPRVHAQQQREKYRNNPDAYYGREESSTRQIPRTQYPLPTFAPPSQTHRAAPSVSNSRYGSSTSAAPSLSTTRARAADMVREVEDMRVKGKASHAAQMQRATLVDRSEPFYPAAPSSSRQTMRQAEAIQAAKRAKTKAEQQPQRIVDVSGAFYPSGPSARALGKAVCAPMQNAPTKPLPKLPPSRRSSGAMPLPQFKDARKQVTTVRSKSPIKVKTSATRKVKHVRSKRSLK